ncbi:MAG: hypothetical protein LBE12_13555 [Planctomycetaceae bacterium]|jgi:hypothetical protein|nr:hypothetical protein [Planctomycetaceae bacterium]
MKSILRTTETFVNTKIAIKDILLWNENARFPDKYFDENQQKLIDYMVLNKDFRIKKFAKEVVNDFGLPQVEKIVVYFDGKSYIVREGNRRLATYKLLANPNLAGREKDFFRKLSENIVIDDEYMLECLVCKKEEDCERIITRKHLKKNNEVSWQDTERARHKIRTQIGKRTDYLKNTISTIVRKLDIPEDGKEKVLGRGFVTIFWRFFIGNIPARYFKFKFDNKNELLIADAKFIGKLKVILWDVINKNVDSRSHNKNKDIEKYLAEINDEKIANISNEFERIANITNGKRLTDVGENKTIFSTETPLISVRKTAITKEVTFRPFGDEKLVLKTGNVNNIYSDFNRLYTYYEANKGNISASFPAIFRLMLRLLVEAASGNSTRDFSKYVKTNFAEAKNSLTPDERNTLSSKSCDDSTKLIQLLKAGGHNYKDSNDLNQTLAMSLIIGQMIKRTDGKS